MTQNLSIPKKGVWDPPPMNHPAAYRLKSLTIRVIEDDRIPELRAGIGISRGSRRSFGAPK